VVYPVLGHAGFNEVLVRPSLRVERNDPFAQAATLGTHGRYVAACQGAARVSWDQRERPPSGPTGRVPARSPRPL